MIAELHTQWDIAFLDQYVADSMVPRSLRWDVSPQKGESELAELFQYFNEAGVKFLQFLAQSKKYKLTRLDIEMKSIKEHLSTLNSSEEYKERSLALKKTA